MLVAAHSYGTDAVGRATTGADGTFLLSGLPADDYLVCFDPADATGGTSSTGYRDTCWKDVDSTDGTSSDQLTYLAVQDGGVVADIVQALPSTGGVSGTVTDRDGTPLPGAVVTAVTGPGRPLRAQGRTTTDANGHYLIERLRPGADYTVCVSAEAAVGGLSAVGYLDSCYGDVPAQFGYTPAASDATTFAVAAETVTAIDAIELDAAVRIEGTLTDKDGQPVAGVKIQGDRSDDGPTVDAAGVTDSNGHYELSVSDHGGWANGIYSGTRLPTGPYRVYYNTYDVPQFVSQRYKGVLTAYGKSFGGAATTVSPAAGVVTKVDDQLTFAATIAGTVTDGQGTGLSGVDVRLYHGDDYLTDTMTDESGQYDFDKLPPGNYKLCYYPSGAYGGISIAGYLSSCGAPFTVTTGQQRTGVDHGLQPASGISGTLRGPSSEPLQYRNVRLYREGSLAGSLGSTNQQGKFLFRELPAGTYKVCFEVFVPIRWEGCYDGATDVASATPITTTLGSVVTGVDGQAIAPVDTTAPTASMTEPTRLVQTSRVVTLGVSTSDTESGVAGYDLRYRYADWNDTSFSSFIAPASWQSRTGPAPTVTGVPGRTYCYSVRARDEAGNVSRYSAEKCVAVPLDDRVLRPTSGRWRRVSSDNTVGNTVTLTSTYGATLTLGGAYVDRVGLVVTTCPTCGRVGVFVNGKRHATLNTWSSTVRKKVLFVPSTFSYRRAAITLRLEQRNRSLVVDALAVTRK